jgi:hypothetical protein
MQNRQSFHGYSHSEARSHQAHNQAVLKGGDKARLFALLQQQMIKAGNRNVGTSYKEARKRAFLRLIGRV